MNFVNQRAQSKETEKGIGLSLAGLVMIAVLPLLLFGGGVAWMVVEQKKSAVAEELASTARALRVAVDRELLSQFTAIEILVNDFSLNATNLADFHNRANLATKANREWLTVALIDPLSHQLIITSPPVPYPLLTSLSPRHVDQVVQTRKPLIVGAFASSKITDGPVILLMSPVIRGNEVRYVLGAAMEPKTISDVFSEQKLPPSWTGAVVDNNMTLAGRSRDPERYVGVRATPSLVNRIDASESGMFSAVNQEGATVHTVFSRSPVTGWSVVIGVPADEVEGPIRRVLFQLAAAGGLLIALALFLTGIVGRAIVRRRNAYEKELQDSQARLQESLHEFSDLVARVPIGVYKFRLLKEGGHRFDFVSARWCEIFGIEEEDVYRDASVAFDRIHPDDLPELLRLNEVARNSSQPFAWEGRWVGISGEIWLRIESSPTLLPNGDSLWNGFVYDVTKRKRSEKEREQFFIFFKSSSDMMCIADPNGSFLTVNPACMEMLGYSEAEIVSKPFIEFVHPDDKQETLDEMERQQRTGSSFAFENRYVCKDGSLRWISWAAAYNNDEKRTYAIGRDITKRKHYEEVIAVSNKLLQAIINNAPMRIFWKDAELRYLGCNKLFAEDAGVGCPDDLIGKDDYQLTWKDQAELYRIDDMRVIESGIPKLSYEELQTRLDGNLMWLHTSKVPLRSEANEIIGVLGMYEDITDLKRSEAEKLALEHQLQQAQKMESLGVLAGGIAHDFNNILAVIICNSSLGMQRPQLAEELFPEIEAAAQRAAALCRQMLTYAGKTQFVESRVDVTALVDDMLGMLKSTLPQNVTIKPYLSGDIPPVMGDASQLRQVVMNLIINASEALGEEQGDVRVALTKTLFGAEHLERDYSGAAITPGTYLCLEVTDSGCGMDEETAGRIFDPFFSTKFVGRGLGMSAVLGIITSHKGVLQLTSRPGRGTTIKIYLPVENSEPTKKELPQQADPTTWRGSGTILLVEDEPQLQEVARTLLETLGFRVIQAANGVEALDQYRKYGAEISLVLTDIGMPLMGGYELIKELKKLDPSLPIVVTSGFGDLSVTSKVAPGEIAGLIGKPYSFNQLREVLQGVVDTLPSGHA